MSSVISSVMCNWKLVFDVWCEEISYFLWWRQNSHEPIIFQILIVALHWHCIDIFWERSRGRDHGLSIMLVWFWTFSPRLSHFCVDMSDDLLHDLRWWPPPEEENVWTMCVINFGHEINGNHVMFHQYVLIIKNNYFPHIKHSIPLWNYTCSSNLIVLMSGIEVFCNALVSVNTTWMKINNKIIIWWYASRMSVFY